MIRGHAVPVSDCGRFLLFDFFPAEPKWSDLGIFDQTLKCVLYSQVCLRRNQHPLSGSDKMSTGCSDHRRLARPGRALNVSNFGCCKHDFDCSTLILIEPVDFGEIRIK